MVSHHERHIEQSIKLGSDVSATNNSIFFFLFFVGGCHSGVFLRLALRTILLFFLAGI